MAFLSERQFVPHRVEDSNPFAVSFCFGQESIITEMLAGHADGQEVVPISTSCSYEKLDLEAKLLIP